MQGRTCSLWQTWSEARSAAARHCSRYPWCLSRSRPRSLGARRSSWRCCSAPLCYHWCGGLLAGRKWVCGFWMTRRRTKLARRRGRRRGRRTKKRRTELSGCLPQRLTVNAGGWRARKAGDDDPGSWTRGVRVYGSGVSRAAPGYSNKCVWGRERRPYGRLRIRMVVVTMVTSHLLARQHWISFANA